LAQGLFLFWLFVPQSRPLPIPAPTLIQEFQGHLARVELAPATIRNYAADVRGFVRFMHQQANGSTPAIPRAQDFIRYRTHLIQVTDQSPATINRRLQALRLFGRFLLEKGYCDENPTQALELIAAGHEDQTPRILDADEIAQLVIAVRASARRSLMRRDYAIIELMLQAGLRINEVAALTRDDLVLTPNGLRLRVRGIARISPGSPGIAGSRNPVCESAGQTALDPLDPETGRRVCASRRVGRCVRQQPAAYLRENDAG
jgi:site-specific recombinase XerC